MIVKTLSYGRVYNLGNYQNERLELTMELDELDVIADAGAVLRKQIDELHEANDKARRERFGRKLQHGDDDDDDRDIPF